MDTQMTLVIFALIPALGLVTVVVVNVMLTAQEAEAAKSLTGQCASFLKNSTARSCAR